MFAAYIDESFDPQNDGIYAVAAVIANTSDWFEIERTWESQVKQSTKARNMRRSKREFYLQSVLACRPFFVVGTVVLQPDFYKTFRDGRKLSWSDIRKTPYFLCCHQTFVNIAQALARSGSGERVAIVCDDSKRYGEFAPQVYETFKTRNRQSASYMGSFDVKSDESCIPLRVADLVASELRLTAQRVLFESDGPTPFFEELYQSGRLGRCSVYDSKGLQLAKGLIDNYLNLSKNSPIVSELA